MCVGTLCQGEGLYKKLPKDKQNQVSSVGPGLGEGSLGETDFAN